MIQKKSIRDRRGCERLAGQPSAFFHFLKENSKRKKKKIRKKHISRAYLGFSRTDGRQREN